MQSFKLPSNTVGIAELDQLGATGIDVQSYLGTKTGQRTVPNVFINGKHVGGNSDLQTLNSAGELTRLLRQQ